MSYKHFAFKIVICILGAGIHVPAASAADKCENLLIAKKYVEFSAPESSVRLQRTFIEHTTLLPELMQYFEPQANPLYCAVAAGTIVLNAILKPLDLVPNQELHAERNVRTGAVVPYRRISQHSFLDTIKDDPRVGPFSFNPPDLLKEDRKIKTLGLSLYQVGAALQYYGLTLKLERALDLELFRRRVLDSITGKENFILVNFAPASLGFPVLLASGHFSPIAAYDHATDSVLIMDVAQHRTEWFWVPVTDLFESMLLDDPAALPRGYLLVNRKVDPHP